MEKTKKRSECPLSSSLDIFGDKWSLLIIRDMMFFHKSTFGDFAKSAEGIATNILTARLQNLEEHELIEKLDHPTSKAKVLYKLTNKAIDLLPILIEIQIWAEKYMEIPAEIKTQMKEAKKNKEEYITTMTKKLKKQMAN